MPVGSWKQAFKILQEHQFLGKQVACLDVELQVCPDINTLLTTAKALAKLDIAQMECQQLLYYEIGGPMGSTG